MVRNQLGLRRRIGPQGLTAELALVAEDMRTAIVAANEAYSRFGFRYALCGGLAAGAYGEPRATKDIDFLLGDEAFVRTGLLVSFAAPFPLQAGRFAIDPIPLPEHPRRSAVLDAALDRAIVDAETSIPILRADDLAYMKLASPRAKDLADVTAMIVSGAVDLAALRALVRDDAELATRLDSAAIEATFEEEG